MDIIFEQLSLAKARCACISLYSTGTSYHLPITMQMHAPYESIAHTVGAVAISIDNALSSQAAQSNVSDPILAITGLKVTSPKHNAHAMGVSAIETAVRSRFRVLARQMLPEAFLTKESTPEHAVHRKLQQAGKSMSRQDISSAVHRGLSVFQGLSATAEGAISYAVLIEPISQIPLAVFVTPSLLSTCQCCFDCLCRHLHHHGGLPGNFTFVAKRQRQRVLQLQAACVRGMSHLTQSVSDKKGDDVHTVHQPPETPPLGNSRVMSATKAAHGSFSHAAHPGSMSEQQQQKNGTGASSVSATEDPAVSSHQSCASPALSGMGAVAPDALQAAVVAASAGVEYKDPSHGQYGQFLAELFTEAAETKQAGIAVEAGGSSFVSVSRHCETNGFFACGAPSSARQLHCSSRVYSFGPKGFDMYVASFKPRRSRSSALPKLPVEGLGQTVGSIDNAQAAQTSRRPSSRAWDPVSPRTALQVHTVQSQPLLLFCQQHRSTAWLPASSSSCSPSAASGNAHSPWASPADDWQSPRTSTSPHEYASPTALRAKAEAIAALGGESARSTKLAGTSGTMGYRRPREEAAAATAVCNVLHASKKHSKQVAWQSEALQGTFFV